MQKPAAFKNLYTKYVHELWLYANNYFFLLDFHFCCISYGILFTRTVLELSQVNVMYSFAFNQIDISLASTVLLAHIYSYKRKCCHLSTTFVHLKINLFLDIWIHIYYCRHSRFFAILLELIYKWWSQMGTTTTTTTNRWTYLSCAFFSSSV